jgi:glycosyltransferase involved in cell wall biosynthesis
MGPNDKIRVMHVTQTLTQGGLEEVVRTYAGLLDRQQFEVTVAYVVGGDVSRKLESAQWVDLVCFQHRSRLRRLFILWRLARRKRIRIVHNHLNWYGLPAALLAGARSVETIHNTYSWFGPRKRFMYGLSTLLADRLIAVSENVRTFTRGLPFLGGRNYVVIPNGIDPSLFSPPIDRALPRARFGLQEDETVIGFAGRLEAEKAVHRLLEAASALNLRHKRLRFLIAGDGVLRKELEGKAGSLGLGNVSFLGYLDDTPSFYQALDIFALPSDYEGLPLTVLEAMAACRPVVAMNVGGVAEAVAHEETGLVVPAGDTPAFIDGLDRLAGDSALRSAFGTAGRRRVVSKFSARAMVARTETLYRDMLSENR